jgi:hypothetical protein
VGGGAFDSHVSVASFSLDFDLLGDWQVDTPPGLTVGLRTYQLASTQQALCMSGPDKVRIFQTAGGDLLGTALDDCLPCGVASHDNMFYVACLADHSVKGLNVNGEVLHSFQGEFHFPFEVAILGDSLLLTEARESMLQEWKDDWDKHQSVRPGQRLQRIKRDERGTIGRRIVVLDLPSGDQRQVIRLKNVHSSFSRVDDTSPDVFADAEMKSGDGDNVGGICALSANQLGLYDSGQWVMLQVK